MFVDNVGSYEDIPSDHDIADGLRAFDTRGVKWRGRKIQEAPDNHHIHSIVATSLAHQQIDVSNPHFTPTPPITPSAPKQDIVNTPKEESLADFIKGVSKGFPRGCLDSVVEVPSSISTLAKFAGNYVLDPFINPLDHILPGQESVSQAIAVYETISYLRTCDSGELVKAVAPEAYKLYTDWDNLSLEERGDLSAYCVGKYGTDFLLPIAAAKGVKAVGTVLKEAAAIERIEKAAGAVVKEAGAIDLAKVGIPLAEQHTVVQKYLLSEELQRDIAEVIENTKNAVQSEAFAEGKALAEEINRSLINSKLTNSQLSSNFTELEKELFTSALEGKTIIGTELKLEALLQAGLEPDRAGFTRAGRALMKHGNREGSVFPKPAGNADALNERGQKVLEMILHHPEKQIIHTEFERYGKIIDIQAPGIGGARYSADGKFIGFLEPEVK